MTKKKGLDSLDLFLEGRGEGIQKDQGQNTLWKGIELQEEGETLKIGPSKAFTGNERVCPQIYLRQHMQLCNSGMPFRGKKRVSFFL